MTTKRETDDVTFYDLFVPLTTKKVIIFLIIIGFCVFFNALFGGFVWDDWTNLIYNPRLKDISLFRIWGSNELNTGIYYRPFYLLYLSYSYSMFGNQTFYYHFFQILFHITNASLLFVLFNRFFNKKAAFILAIIFLIHPIQVESVSWISATIVPLSFLFGISALLLTIDGKNTLLRMTIIYILLLLTVFTRETGFIFLFLIVYLQRYYMKSNTLKYVMLSLFVLLTYLFCRFIFGKVFFDYHYFSPFMDLSLQEKLINAPAIFFYYLKTFVFPYQLAINQLWIIKEINVSSFYFPLLAIIVFLLLLVIAAVYIKKKKNDKFIIYIFFMMWFFFGCLSLSPFSPLDLTVADRFFYFPLAGLLGMIGVLANNIIIKKESIKIMLVITMTVILVALAVRTIVRNDNWKSYFNLVKHDIQIENNFDIQSQYGTLLVYEYKDHKGALPHFLKSVEMFPHEVNLKNVGTTYLNLGKQEEALEYFYKALNGKNFSSQRKHNKSTYEALATLLVQMNDWKEAKRIATLGIEDGHQSLELYSILIHSEYKLNHISEALIAAEKASRLFPNSQVKNIYTRLKNGQSIELHVSQ